MQLCLTQQQALARYYPAIEKEYRYWMEGAVKLGINQRFKRVVRMDDGSLLNRYWDNLAIPRQESYLEDVRTADTAVGHLLQDSVFRNAVHQQQIVQDRRSKIYLDLRAAAASGWDFSSRWFADGQTLSSIYTTDIVPVDLNCLLILSEKLVSQHSKDPALKKMATANLSKRIAAIRKYCWNTKAGYFTDHDLNRKEATDRLTLASG
jgi:alpha,alpha-trehalase